VGIEGFLGLRGFSCLGVLLYYGGLLLHLGCLLGGYYCILGLMWVLGVVGL
jgi:hypothetical protein